jgi:hypothetical protein
VDGARSSGVVAGATAAGGLLGLNTHQMIPALINIQRSQ